MSEALGHALSPPWFPVPGRSQAAHSFLYSRRLSHVPALIFTQVTGSSLRHPPGARLPAVPLHAKLLPRQFFQLVPPDCSFQTAPLSVRSGKSSSPPKSSPSQALVPVFSQTVLPTVFPARTVRAVRAARTARRLSLCCISLLPCAARPRTLHASLAPRPRIHSRPTPALAPVQAFFCRHKPEAVLWQARRFSQGQPGE